MHPSRLLSWASVAGGVALLAFAGYTRFANPTLGEWRRSAVGLPVGKLPVDDLDGAVVDVRHPSILYFFDRKCRFCPGAAARLQAYLARHPENSLPIYAVTNEWGIPRAYTAQFVAPIRVVRMERTTHDLTFVTDLPLLVRTDARGRVQHAYVGLPDEDALATLASPGAVGPPRR
ncbi:MAG TPA: hypothetical protein VM890_00470 [Longimicrobium sp.]|jgi:hypothetical protein|nr:hypothetical protein [Longimicrobium sp.]